MKALIARLRLMSRQHNTLAIGDEAADALEAQAKEIETLQEAIIRLVGSEQGERLAHKCRVIAADKVRRK